MRKIKAAASTSSMARAMSTWSNIQLPTPSPTTPPTSNDPPCDIILIVARIFFFTSVYFAHWKMNAHQVEWMNIKQTNQRKKKSMKNSCIIFIFSNESSTHHLVTLSSIVERPDGLSGTACWLNMTTRVLTGWLRGLFGKNRSSS